MTSNNHHTSNNYQTSHTHHASSNHVDNSHGTYKSYIVGFVLSILLTLASYFTVTTHAFPTYATYILVSLLAFAQLFVQLIFFLHLASESRPRWNLTSFIFTVFIVLVLVGGSLWVMYHMNANMM